MNIPDLSKGEVPKPKITEYLLRLDHPEGGSKAKFFLERGFTEGHWKQFAEAIRKQAGEKAVSDVVEGRFGTKYVVDAPICCPDASSPEIRTVWIVEHESTIPRLVTAHPM